MTHRLAATLTALAALLAFAGCSTPPTNDFGFASDTGIDPALIQEITLPAGEITEPIQVPIVSPYYPDRKVVVTVRPPGSQKTVDEKGGTQDVVATKAEADGSGTTEAKVNCPICGKPIKVRVRRPKPTGALVQEIYLPLGDLGEPAQFPVVNPYQRDQRVQVTVKPAGSEKSFDAEGRTQDVVIEEGVLTMEAQIDAPNNGKPIKLRVRRPKPRPKKPADADW